MEQSKKTGQCAKASFSGVNGASYPGVKAVSGPDTERGAGPLADEAANDDIQVVILAAGRGSRLNGETDSRPKCLVDVGGKTLLEHQIQRLHEAGISNIHVVAGYEANQVSTAIDNRAAIIFNQQWAATNSLYSLWLTRHWISGPLLVLNCDVLAHSDIVSRLLASGGNSFVYDSSSGGEDEHMKVQLDAQILKAMSKSLPANQNHGENVGMLYFNSDTVGLLFEEAEAALADKGNMVWAAEAVERVARKQELRGIDVSGLPWIEIDYPEDLVQARQLTWPAILALPIGQDSVMVENISNNNQNDITVLNAASARKQFVNDNQPSAGGTHEIMDKRDTRRALMAADKMLDSYFDARKKDPKLNILRKQLAATLLAQNQG